MCRRNTLIRFLSAIAGKYRIFQQKWIFSWWKSRCLKAVPLWALDIFVLIVKLCSTCVMAIIKTLLPGTLKSLHGETVLITGAGSGIGRELAIQFSEHGATVICWDIDAERNRVAVEEVRKRDGDCFSFTVDVSVLEQVKTAAMLTRRLAEVSMIVSNAGILTYAPFTCLQSDEIAKTVQTNLFGHIWVIYTFLPKMIERRQGHIVAVNSSAGLSAWPQMVPYCAAKFGLRGLMDSLSEELRLQACEQDIHTTSVYLGTVATGLYPEPSHRFRSWYSEISAKDAAKIIIKGVRRNKKYISIPCCMKTLIQLCNIMPHRIRSILQDFFNFSHRGWFCFC